MSIAVFNGDGLTLGLPRHLSQLGSRHSAPTLSRRDRLTDVVLSLVEDWRTTTGFMFLDDLEGLVVLEDLELSRA